jgi:hypothetical protein
MYAYVCTASIALRAVSPFLTDPPGTDSVLILVAVLTFREAVARNG